MNLRVYVEIICGEMMESLLRNLVPVAIGAVAVVLALGLFNLLRGGNANRSQRLMRWRIGLQFLAVILIMATVYFTAK
jgi:hypothetical protein